MLYSASGEKISKKAKIKVTVKRYENYSAFLKRNNY